MQNSEEWLYRSLLAALLLIVIQAVVIAQQSNRARGPFAWDDEVMQELRAVRLDHNTMQREITTNTQRLADLSEELKNHESNQLSSQFSERLTSLETKVKGFSWICGILAAAVMSDLVHRVVDRRKMK